jgi:hypothetical protein
LSRIAPATPAPSTSWLFDELAQHVQHRDVRLLDARGDVGRHDDRHVDGARELAAPLADESDAAQAPPAGLDDGLQHVPGVAGGGDRHGQIARATVRLHQPREHVIEAVVVADRGQVRAVGGERQGGQRRPLAVEATRQLVGEVLRIRGRPAVAEGEQLAPAAQRLDGKRRRIGDRVATGDHGLALHAGARLEALAQLGEQRLALGIRGIAHPGLRQRLIEIVLKNKGIGDMANDRLRWEATA